MDVEGLMSEFLKQEQKRTAENKILNFLELSEAEENLLKKRIEENQGLIRVFVHPYFEKISPFLNKKRAEQMKVMNLALQKILSLPEEKTPPILFFEEEEEIPQLEEGIGDIELKNKIYTIPTFSCNPGPRINKEEFNVKTIEKNWKVVIDKLKSLEVKKILIGGIQLLAFAEASFSPDKSDEIKYQGCVGGAINHLSENFDIEISNLAFPESRKDVDEIKKRIKFKKQL